MQVLLYKRIATDKGSVGTLMLPPTNTIWMHDWATIYRYNSDSMYKNISFRMPKSYINVNGYSLNGAIIKDSPVAGYLFYNLSYENDFQSGYVKLHLSIDPLTTYVFEMKNNLNYGNYEYIYNLFGPLSILNGQANIPYELAFKYRNEGKLESKLNVNLDPSSSKYSTYKKFVMHHRVSTPEHWNTSLSDTSVAPWLKAYGSFMGDSVQGGLVERPNRQNSNSPLHLSDMINQWLGGATYDGGEFDYIEYLPDLQTSGSNVVNFGLQNPGNISIGTNDTVPAEGIERVLGSSFLGVIGYMEIMPDKLSRSLYNYGPKEANATVTIGGMFTKSQSYNIPIYNQLSVPYHIEFRYYLNVNQDVEVRVYAVPGGKYPGYAIDDYQTDEYTTGFKLLQTIPITGLRIPYFIDPAVKEVVTTLNQLDFNPVAFLLIQIVQAVIDIFGEGFGEAFDNFISLINAAMTAVDPNSKGLDLHWSDIVKTVDGVQTIQVEKLTAEAIMIGVLGYVAHGIFDKLDLSQLGELIPAWGELAAGIGNSVISIFKSIGGVFAATLGTYLTMGVKTMFKYLNKVGYISDLGSKEQEAMSDYVGFGSANNPFTLSVSTPYFEDISKSEYYNQPQILDIPIHTTTRIESMTFGYNYTVDTFSKYNSMKNYGMAIRDMWPGTPNVNATLNLPDYIVDAGREILETTGAKIYSKNNV